MPDRRSDIVIIGGGPAGSAAAIEAARLGFAVTVVDKAAFPRPKCCGDGLTTGALRHLADLGVDLGLLPSTRSVDDVVLVPPSGREIRYRFPASAGRYAAVVRRSELDHAMIERAGQVGATIRERTELVSLDPGHSGYRHRRARVGIRHLDRSDTVETIEADLVVAADGMWSPSRKLLGIDIGDYRGEWHAFRQYFHSASPRALNDLIVWFEPDILPGYVWSFPLGDGTVNVGFGIRRNHRHRVQEMKQLWADVVDRPAIRSVLGPDVEPEGPHRAWPIPARLGRLPLDRGRVVFVGDAAAATDPMTGEGIGQAMETGRLIIERLAGADGSVPEAIIGYRTELERGMIRDHRMADLLSGVLANPTGAEIALRTTALTGWTRRNFVRWLFEDYPRATLVTPRRWRRSTFTTPPPVIDGGKPPCDDDAAWSASARSVPNAADRPGR